MEVADIVQFSLRDGSMVEIQMSQRLIDNIKASFGLGTNEKINSQHVKHYLVNSMKNFLDEKNEQSICQNNS